MLQRQYFANKGSYSPSYGFSSSHVWMGELDNKKGWALKKWCIQTVVLEKTLESHWDNKQIKPINSKRNQPWIFIGRTHAEAEPPIIWLPNTKIWKESFLLENILKLGKTEGKRRSWWQRIRWLDGSCSWMTQMTWIWANSGRQWRMGKTGMLKSMGSQRAGHNLVTEQQYNHYKFKAEGIEMLYYELYFKYIYIYIKNLEGKNK